jgi:hypothetical protein
MTTIYPFQPSMQAPFQFQPTLDGAVYNCIVTWCLFRGGKGSTTPYYLNIYSLDGTLVVSRALVASPVGVSVQNINWANGRAYATTISPHGYPVGTVVNLSLSGNVPAAYSGIFECLITGASTFWYAVAPNPGPASTLGVVTYDIDLVEQYFQTTTLVFRDGVQNFEVTDLSQASINGNLLAGGGSGIFTLGSSTLGGGDVLG